MKVLLVIVATVLHCANAQAQVRKCTGPDGKVTYSDSICADNTARETSVGTNSNTIDASGLREQAQKSKAKAAAENAASHNVENPNSDKNVRARRREREQRCFPPTAGYSPTQAEAEANRKCLRELYRQNLK